jgi:thiol-disulfide isomerase/thioredoxin
MAKTRRNKKGSKILDVRSDGAVKLFEKALVKGPLTLVYVNAKWCGACHRFNDEVWSPLTKLKNRSVNLASVDSEYIGKTSLANVPRKFYPTLMLVGKDKKPATFEDEEGQPTNAMPRNPTLAQDKEALSNLVVNPTVKTNLSLPSNTPAVPNVAVNNLQRMNSPPRASVTMNSLLPKPMNSPPRANVTKSSLAKSPFEAMDTPVFSNSPATTKTMDNTRMNSKKIMSSNPPDIGADLVASQKQAMPLPIQGGGLLNAIKGKTAQLKSMLQMRKHLTRRNRK